MMTDADYCNTSAFSCGEKELDDFFRYELRDCVKYKYLSAYCAVSEDGTLVALFTLMNDAIVISGQDEKQDFIDDLRYDTDNVSVDFFSRQPCFPAINIGHLGISANRQGCGIGSSIIDLVVVTFSRYTRAGCQFVTVDAINNPKALQFYHKNGFVHQTARDINSSTRRMYRILTSI